jgi:hypothetical protein
MAQLRDAMRTPLVSAREWARRRAAQAAEDGKPAPRDLIAEAQLWELADRYGGSFEVPAISYGTVRDLADSTEHIAGLAGASFDMKNLQRCWMLKTILGTVPRGGRLVEIGAGEPMVAGILARLGYDVTVVDPYDGSGNGPKEYEQFRRDYPELTFVREQFSASTPLPGTYAAVYSISVLEHVPDEAVGGVMEAANELVAPSGGCSVHAVDHVVAGWSADEHLERLKVTVAGAGLDVSALEATIAELERDPDTYFVSAEAHDRWRGHLAYDDYPMRRIVSIQLFKQA